MICFTIILASFSSVIKVRLKETKYYISHKSSKSELQFTLISGLPDTLEAAPKLLSTPYS